MYYSAIKYNDIANGPGVRTTLFVSGCTHHCKGCFQPETWNFTHGHKFTADIEDKIIDSLASPYIHGFTILGGEPMEPTNQGALVQLIRRIKSELSDKHISIWCYTGDVFEDLVDEHSSRHTCYTNELLSSIDVLVDGLFVENLKDIRLRFRGSSNQRLLDMQKSMPIKQAIEWIDEPIFTTHNL